MGGVDRETPDYTAVAGATSLHDPHSPSQPIWARPPPTARAALTGLPPISRMPKLATTPPPDRPEVGSVSRSFPQVSAVRPRRPRTDGSRGSRKDRGQHSRHDNELGGGAGSPVDTWRVGRTATPRRQARARHLYSHAIASTDVCGRPSRGPCGTTESSAPFGPLPAEPLCVTKRPERARQWQAKRSSARKSA